MSGEKKKSGFTETIDLKRFIVATQWLYLLWLFQQPYLVPI